MKNHGVVVADMVIEKALIAAPHGPQLLRTMAEMDRTENCAKLVFSTVDVRVSFVIVLTNLANFTSLMATRKRSMQNAMFGFLINVTFRTCSARVLKLELGYAICGRCLKSKRHICSTSP